MAGASTLTNSPVAVPTAKPDGNCPADLRYDVYSSLLSNDGRMESVSVALSIEEEEDSLLWYCVDVQLFEKAPTVQEEDIATTAMSSVEDMLLLIILVSFIIV